MAVRPGAPRSDYHRWPDDKNTIDQAFRELCDAYIVKPIDTEEVIDIVRCLFPLGERTP